MAQIESIYSPEVEGQLKRIYTEIEKHQKKIIEVSKMSVDFYGGKTATNPSQLNSVTDAINKQQKAVENLNKSKAKLQVKTSEEIVNQKALAQASDRQARATSNLVGAYARLNAQHQMASQKLRDLTVQFGASNKATRQAQMEFDVLDKKVKQADSAVRVFNRNVGNYPTINAMAGSLRNLMSAFGVVGGVYMFAKVVKDAFKTIKDFDKASRDLSATMGKNINEIKLLTNNAKQLGATTRYTATEITGLQKELAKLGFSQTEILNSTKAISNLASAVDTDLANAAMVAGSTLRSFNLDSSEMARVVDVMSKSFTSSALDIENFKESIKYVGPIASAGNISLEQTTALLGILADNGIKGSQAGTSLRRIMTDLIRTGKPFNEAFTDVAKNGISVKDAFDEVGRTAQTSLIVLGKNTEKIKELGIALKDAGGSAQKMADEQLKSLSGQIDLMTSAWDGFIMSLNEGGNKLSSFLIKIINQVTQTITLWQKLLSSAETIKSNNDTSLLAGSQNLAKRNLDVISGIENKEKFAREQIISLEKQKAEINKSIIDLKKKNLEIVKTDTRNTPLGKILPTQSKNEIKNNKKAIEDYNLQLIKNQGLINGYNASLEKKKELIVEETESIIKSNNVQKEQNEIIKIGTEKWIKDQISQLEELRSTNDTTAESYKLSTKTIEFYNQWLERLKGTTKEVKEETDGVSLSLKDLENGVAQVEGSFDELGALTFFDDFKQSFVDTFKDNSGFSKMFDLLTTDLEKYKDDATATALAVSDAFQQAFNTIASNSQANFDAERLLNEQKYSYAMQFANGNAEAEEQLAIEKERRNKEIARREAQQRKRLAIFNIGIDTAQALVAQLAATPLPYGTGFLLAIAALGAAQIAMVSSQQIPEFYKGTENAPEGWAKTDERGAEIHTDSKGNIKDFGSKKGTRLKYLNKGDKILTAQKTKDLLFKNQSLPIENSNFVNIDLSSVEKKLDKLVNKSEFTLVKDANGERIFEKHNGMIKELKNNRIKLKPRNVRA